MSIIVDESEPEYDVDDPPFEPRNIKVRKDKWVTDEYEIQDFLGRGKFGEVNKCVERSTGNFFAAKFISAPTAQDKKEVEHEIAIMKRLQHKRLLQLYDAFEARNEMCLVLEIILGGELFDRVICDDFILTERACVMFMRQICEGMDYMHSKQILHLDMKPENILCLSKTGNRIKIIDFGLARDWTPKSDLRVMFGTAEFMAPEVVNYEPISPATDMWSVGVICYVLLSGLSPFMGDNDGETLSNVIKGDYDFDYPEFDDVSEDAKAFISKLLILDKTKRMTATEALEHKWLRRPSKSRKKKKAEPTLSKTHLRKFVFRRKWQKAVNAMVALRRMGVNLRKSDLSKPQEADIVDNMSDASSLSEPPIDDEVLQNECTLNGDLETLNDKAQLPDKKGSNNDNSSLLPEAGHHATGLARKVSSDRESGGSSGGERPGYNTLKRYERKKDASKGKINIQDHRPVETQDKANNGDKQGKLKSSQSSDDMSRKSPLPIQTISAEPGDAFSAAVKTDSEIIKEKSQTDKPKCEEKQDEPPTSSVAKEINNDSTDQPKAESVYKTRFATKKAKPPPDYNEGKPTLEPKAENQKESKILPTVTKSSAPEKDVEQNGATLKAEDNKGKDRTPSLSPHRNFRSNLQRKSAEKDSNELNRPLDNKKDITANYMKKTEKTNGDKEANRKFMRESESPKPNAVSANRDLFEKNGSQVKRTSAERELPKKLVTPPQFQDKDRKRIESPAPEVDTRKKPPVLDITNDKSKTDASFIRSERDSKSPFNANKSTVKESVKQSSPQPSSLKNYIKRSELSKYKDEKEKKMLDTEPHVNITKEPEPKELPCKNRGEEVNKDLPRYKLDNESPLRQTAPPHKNDHEVVSTTGPAKIQLPRKSESPDTRATVTTKDTYKRQPDYISREDSGYVSHHRKKSMEDVLDDDVLRTETVQEPGNRSEMVIQIAGNEEKLESVSDVQHRRGSDDRERSKSLEKEHHVKILSNVLQRFADRERSKSLEKDRGASSDKEQIEIHIGNIERRDSPPTILVKQRPAVITESSVIKMDINPNNEYTVNKNYTIKESPDASSDEVEINIGRPSTLTRNVSRLVSNLESTGKFPHCSDSSDDDDDEATNRQTVKMMTRGKPHTDAARVQRITLGGAAAGGVHKITIGGGGIHHTTGSDLTDTATCSAPRFTGMRMKTSDTPDSVLPNKAAVAGKNSVVTERYLRPSLTSKRFNIGSKQYVQMFDTDQGQVVQRFEDRYTRPQHASAAATSPSAAASDDKQSSSFRQFIRKFEMGGGSETRPAATFEVSNVRITSNSSRFRVYETDKDGKRVLRK